jgi:TolB-like protein/tetratricopeptide (TPR) repeat protein
VLPFQNEGDSADAYLVDGFSDAVRGKLATLPTLRVIAGASSTEYRHTRKSPKAIAGELGVRYLVVGKVRREGRGGEQDRMRVSTELVEVGARGPLTTRWAEPADGPLSDMLQMESDVARSVAEALGLALGSKERLNLGRRPTENLAAYEAFLRGEQSLGGVAVVDPAVVRRALSYYEQAVALDTAFVEAWVRLSQLHLVLHTAGSSPADATAAQVAAERALALAPDRPEGHLALGEYYGSMGESEKALDHYTLGLRLAPHNSEAITAIGMEEQYTGRWDAALAHFREAYALDPRSETPARALAWALFYLHRYPEALAFADRALALVPTEISLAQVKTMIHLGRGDLPAARSVIRAALKRVEPASLVAVLSHYYDLYWVLENPEQQLLLQLPPSAFDNDRATWGLVMAQTYALRSDSTRMHAYADSARLAFEEQLKAALDDDQGAQLHTLHGLALAYLGRRAEAIREGERGVALTSKDNIDRGYMQHQLVRIHLLLGEQDQALDLLEELLRVPYLLSPGWLKVDPTFTPLHGNPRFERLTKGTI